MSRPEFAEDAERAQLIQLLSDMVMVFKPFDARPIGAPGSVARAEQDEQISAYNAAVKFLAKVRGNAPTDAAR